MKINRPTYLKRLIDGRNNGIIKIVTGLRRCGKSYLLFTLFHDWLVDNGIEASKVIRIALDDVRNMKYLDPVALVEHVAELTKGDGEYVVMLDEVQLVENFPAALNSLLRIPGIDLYVTGSNSRFLSSDVATQFRGRGDEIHMYPLSFTEFSSVYNGSIEKAWEEYVTYGGLPQIIALKSHDAKAQFLKNIYQSVYIKDLLERYSIGKPSEFETLVDIMASGIGSPCNPFKLSNTFKTIVHKELGDDTVKLYLRYLEEAFLLEKACRYDVKGKKYIGTLSKYYFSDIGVRNAVLNFRQQEENHIMENIIYNHLRAIGYGVDVGLVSVSGKDDEKGMVRRQQLEVDFVVNCSSNRYYIQSAYAIPDKEKLAQESASLTCIKDNFKKIIIVNRQITPWYTDNGIRIVGLFDFLLSDNPLEL